MVSGALRLHITDCRQEDLGPFAIRDVPIAMAEAEADRNFLAIPAFNREHRVFRELCFLFLVPNRVFFFTNIPNYPTTSQVARVLEYLIPSIQNTILLACGD